MEDTCKQARARASTWVVVCRSFSSTTESFLLLLLLLPHQNVSEMQRKQVGSLTLGALTLSLSLSPHAATPAPAAKEFCICIHTLDCCAALRPPPFAGATLFISKGYCIAKGGRRAQDAYLIDASCEVAFLHMLGRTLPMLESPAAPI